jgi:hypothetical protein
MTRACAALLALLAAPGCGGPYRMPPAMHSEGIAAWNYVEPPLASRAQPLPAVHLADFASLPGEESFHPALTVPGMILPLVGWIMPAQIHSRNALLLSIPSGRLLGEYELAPLRRYEFERVLARELVRSGLFEAVVTDPARATLELRGRVDFQREHRVHFMGLGLLWWPLFYWVPSSTQLDRCEGRYELVRRADGALLHAADFRVEERELVLDRLGNETLLTSLGARILPQVIQDIVRELAALEAP